MIKVYVNKQSSYPVSSPNIKKGLRSFLKEHGIVSDSDVYVHIVGKKKMIDLAKKYLKENGALHNVLTFSDAGFKKEFVYPPGDIIHLGQIFVCYPKAVEEAKDENKMIAEKVLELVEHGGLHLLGKHHE
jgi:probable rRNA maturation factor